MPKGVIPPYEGECRRAGDGAMHDDDVTGLGRYRGLCGVCRPIVADQQRQARLDRADVREPAEPTRELPPPGVNKVDVAVAARLTDTVQRLVPMAKRLESAVESRRLATVQARAMLSEFKAGLHDVQIAAQSLLNRSTAAGETT